MLIARITGHVTVNFPVTTGKIAIQRLEALLTCQLFARESDDPDLRAYGHTKPLAACGRIFSTEGGAEAAARFTACSLL
jgi:hypothetical protein